MLGYVSLNPKCFRKSDYSPECGPGKYGGGCGQTCSVHCSGTGDPCDHITGHCTNGCDAGYTGDKCDQGENILMPKTTVSQLSIECTQVL